MDLDADNVNSVSALSLRRPPAQQDTPLDQDRHHIYRKVAGMLIWASLVRPDLQFSAKDHTRHLTAPSEWDWSHLKHTLWYIKGTLHYKFLISPRLPQGHALPLRQPIPLNIHTYCDSDWAADIKLRKSTSGTVTSVLSAPLAFNSRTQSTVATSSAEAELYAISSASATAYTSTSYFKNFNNIFNARPSTLATSRLSTTSTIRSVIRHH